MIQRQRPLSAEASQRYKPSLSGEGGERAGCCPSISPQSVVVYIHHLCCQRGDQNGHIYCSQNILVSIWTQRPLAANTGTEAASVSAVNDETETKAAVDAVNANMDVNVNVVVMRTPFPTNHTIASATAYTTNFATATSDAVASITSRHQSAREETEENTKNIKNCYI